MLQIELDLDKNHERGDAEARREWRLALEALRDFMGEHRFDGEYKLRPIAKNRWRADTKVPLKLAACDTSKHAIRMVLRAPEVGGNAAWESLLITPQGINTEVIYDRFQDILARKRADAPTLTSNGNSNGEGPLSKHVNGHAKFSALDKLLASGSPGSRLEIHEMAKPVPATGPAPYPGDPKSYAENLETIAVPAMRPAEPGADEIPSANRILRQIQSLEASANRERGRRKRLTELSQQRQEMEAKIQECREKLNALEAVELEVLEACDQDTEAKAAIEALKAFSGLLASTPN